MSQLQKNISKFNEANFKDYRNNFKSLKKPHQERVSRIYQIFNEEIERNKNLSILDIGCADGYISSYFVDKGAEVYGLDISAKNIQFAKKLGIKARLGDVVNGLPFENDKFDIILMGELIEHLFDPDSVIRETYRVLNKNGILILTFPNLASLPNRIRLVLGYHLMHFDTSLNERHGGHIRGFTAFSIKKFLKKNNFEVEKIYGSSISLHPFKRTNSNFGVFLGRLCPKLADLLIIQARKQNSG